MAGWQARKEPVCFGPSVRGGCESTHKLTHVFLVFWNFPRPNLESHLWGSLFLRILIWAPPFCLLVMDFFLQWLHSVGIRGADASGRDVIVASAPVNVLERIFATTFYAYKHTASGKIQTRHFGQLNTPADLDNVIEFVSGLTELWEPSHLQSVRRPATTKRNDVSAGYIIPAVLRNMYGIPSTFRGQQKSSICVAEFQDDASYSPKIGRAHV